MNTPNTPTIFNFRDHAVRAIQDEHGEPWFVAADVCDILEHTNSRMATEGLDDDELMSVKLTSGGQMRDVNVISESGLYTLIIRSNKPQAKIFRKWVTAEVLPSIRKHGSYCLPMVGEEPEVGLATGPAPITVGRLAEAAQGIKSAMIMARSFGYRDEQARRLANEIVLDLTGIDALELLGPSEEESRALALPMASDQPPAGKIDEKTLAEFVADACELDEGATVGAGELYRAFCQWLHGRQGEAWPMPPMRQFNQTVSRHFRRHEAQVMHGGWERGRFYLGLSLPGQEIHNNRLIDAVRDFVSERCVCTPGARATATNLYRAFSAWCVDNGNPAPSMKSFGGCLAAMFDRRKNGGYVIYIGVALAEEVCHG